MLRFLSLPLLTIVAVLQTALAESVDPITWDTAKHTFSRYCKECHGETTPDADLDLVSIDHKADLAAQPEKWTNILKALRTHYMPHPDGRELPLEKREPLIEKIRHELVLQAGDYAPTSAALRRLNRVEFSNTLNDLFFVEENWAESLPADDAGYGFDNIAAALSLSPLLLERYFDAAAQVAMHAVPQKVPASEWSISASNFKGGIKNGPTMWIVTSGNQRSAHHPIFFPAKGHYQLTLHLSAQQAGPEKARAELWIDGERLGTYEVTADRNDSPNTIQQVVQINKPGEHRVEVRMTKDYFNETETGKEDRNLIFHKVAIHGPTQTAKDLTSPFLDRHFKSLPERLSNQELRNGIHRFASRAFRRPIIDEEGDALWQVFQANVQGIEGDRRNGLYAVIDAVLTSPSFLFRVEGGPEIETNQEFALASWLSYFLWSSMPDDRLFDLALHNELQANLESEVQRMLADPRAVALADNFAGQWWRIRDLDFHKPDTQVYQGVDKALLAAMHEETRRFFAYVIEEDRPLLDFLTADYTFVNQRLASHYGIEDIKGKHFRKVSLKSTPRRGVWTQAGILTVTSHPNHTSPVLRGQWILENLIGLSPPPPPDNVPSLPNTDGKPDPSDLRSSLAQHRENPDCASCHNTMDPFGLALEHFDGVGVLRSAAERAKLTEDTLFDGTVIRNPIELAEYLETKRSKDFTRNVAKKLSIYASGRGLEWRDDAPLERIAEHAQSNSFKFSAMVQAIVNEFAPIRKPASLTQAP
ncbi:MAG: DUF1592 domain-containing protein [Opitutaceae bacterium]